MKHKILGIITILLVTMVSALSAGLLVKQTALTGTVMFSSGGTGYVCFLDYSNSRGGPLCLEDGQNVTVPYGEYPIAFFATKIPQDTTFNGLIGNGGVAVGNWTVYSDPFSFQANMMVTGDGALTVLWVNATPVPEFNGIAIVTFSALAASLYVLRRRRT